MKDGIGELYTRVVRAICRMKMKNPKGMQPPKDIPWDETKMTTKATLKKIMTELNAHINKTTEISIPKEVKHSKRK